MGDLAERIRGSVENPNSDPWFPELTAALTASAWGELSRDIGLTADTYGTARLLSRAASAPRDIVRSLETCRSNHGMPISISIEALPLELAFRYHRAGITFYSSDDILNTEILTCIHDALRVIERVPSLMSTVASLVRSFHVIEPKDLHNDVSFSEPHIPFSIFVSVPKRHLRNGALRVAEAIVHEAMHLQLTLMEASISFAISRARKYYSPWRKEYRDAQGILHALYVFRVIERFLEELAATKNDALCDAEYVNNRRREINQQLARFRTFRFCAELSVTGARLVLKLI